ncbi:hypothetical protein Ga0466249_002230 [Sporomusaceae bacterium BoRhaA]|uniref:hypothetical protein n=1 Tax=Pelorhabdus rhamnosifermentans TaxID=2772457 RepID=UPI001C05FA60|nr:hypothetical protein [Pelorhabdus rhamnosifermentans]MBU2701119.1 hypothetical protein [Pelorhabdus rhamnosifermentans]
MNNGVGEKVIVYEQLTKENCEMEKIKFFFKALSEPIQDEILLLGVANYCLSHKDDKFLKDVHETLFPGSNKKICAV